MCQEVKFAARLLIGEKKRLKSEGWMSGRRGGVAMPTPTICNVILAVFLLPRA